MTVPDLVEDLRKACAARVCQVMNDKLALLDSNKDQLMLAVLVAHDVLARTILMHLRAVDLEDAPLDVQMEVVEPLMIAMNEATLRMLHCMAEQFAAETQNSPPPSPN